jgi:hypothetical protein
MIRFHTCICVALAAALEILSGQAGPVRGEDFRVENAVYENDKQEPSNQSTTIFRKGVVYDCLKSPAETVVFDQTAGRFVLLDLTHRTRSEVTTADVTALIERLRPVAAKSQDPVVRFFAQPKFQESGGEAGGALTLTSPMVSYRITLARQTDPDWVERYHEFCDWYARLNSLLVPGSRPPFARLVVNAAVAQRQAVASEVSLTVTIGKGTNRQRITIHSEHRVVSPLEEDDLDLVARTRGFMGSFKLVTFDQYRKVELK